MSSGARGSNRLRNLGNLIAGADDLAALAIGVVLNILVFALSALPDLDFAAASDDADTHSGEKIVGSVRVHVDAAVEHCCSIFANTTYNRIFSGSD